MKKILFLTCIYINIITPAIPDTMNVNWMVDGNVYDTSTCTVGGDIILPTTPTKRGYTFLGWSATTIPTTEYTPIEYIVGSNGTQYINTGFAPNQDTRVVMEYLVPSNNYDSTGLFGARHSLGNRSFLAMYTRDFFFRSDYGDDRSNKIENIPASYYDSKIKIDKNKNVTQLYDNDGILKSTFTSPSETFQVNYNIIYPGFNSAGNNLTINKTRIYSFKIYDDGTLIRDFIPVLDPNGVACMYDTVSGEYFYNAGTGDFVAGPAI